MSAMWRFIVLSFICAPAFACASDISDRTLRTSGYAGFVFNSVSHAATAPA